VAPFDGLVADRYPEQLDMISVGQKILTLLTMVVVPVNYALLYGVRR
jgi:hypothetical protein